MHFTTGTRRWSAARRSELSGVRQPTGQGVSQGVSRGWRPWGENPALGTALKRPQGHTTRPVGSRACQPPSGRESPRPKAPSPMDPRSATHAARGQGPLDRRGHTRRRPASGLGHGRHGSLHKTGSLELSGTHDRNRRPDEASPPGSGSRSGTRNICQRRIHRVERQPPGREELRGGLTRHQGGGPPRDTADPLRRTFNRYDSRDAERPVDPHEGLLRHPPLKSSHLSFRKVPSTHPRRQGSCRRRHENRLNLPV